MRSKTSVIQFSGFNVLLDELSCTCAYTLQTDGVVPLMRQTYCIGHLLN